MILSHTRYCGDLDSPSHLREWLPTVNQFANTLKDLMGETLAKVVGVLGVGVNFKDNNLTNLHMAPEEAPFDVEVFGTRGEMLVDCQK
jgi:hypothetical protein